MPKKQVELEEFLTNLKKNNDAIIIIGDKCAPTAFKIDESTKESFNRKQMVKSPKEFWTWYYENIYSTSDDITFEEKAINDLIYTDIAKLVINVNNTDHIKGKDDVDLIELRGNKTLVKCMSCGEVFVLDRFDINNIEDKVLKCFTCNGKIAPTVTMFNEKYRETDLKAIKDAIFLEEDNKITLNTHTLIFIGVDFEENYMHELIESFNAVKDTMPDKENYYTVMICEKDGISIEYYEPELATFEDIAGAVNRLTSKIKEVE